MPDRLQVEQQAQRIMSTSMQTLFSNIRRRLPHNWAFGIIFFEKSHAGSPTVFAANGCDRREFIEVCDRFVKSARKGRTG